MTTAAAASKQNLILAGPVGSLDAYIQALGAIPVLSKREEQRLSRAFREDGDLNAARSLVLAHLRFVVYIAKGYRGYGLPLNDLIQEGNIGLMKAVKRFDPDVGVRLCSFAVHWIRAEIQEYVFRNWRVVKVATTKAQRKLFFNLRKAKKNLAWLSAEETDVVAKDLGVSRKEVIEMERRLAARDPSFDPPPGGDAERAFSPADYLSSPESDPALLVEEANWESDVGNRMHEALSKLDERSRHILESRWLTDNKQTLLALGAQHGVSAERIRQIESNAMKKLRAAMTA